MGSFLGILTLTLTLICFPDGFTGDLRTDEVLGDLTREEALRFVRGGGKDFSGKEWPGLVNGYTGTPALHKEDWENVWAMCGGNIHLLRVCVKKASRFKDWGKGKSWESP